MDGYYSNHAYPRTTDPSYNKPIEIKAVTSDAITLNVGSTPTIEYTPTGATYTPTTGLLELTIGSHGITTGESVKLLDGAVTFTCTEGAGNHSYPRTTIDNHTATNGAYNPTTGIMTLTVAGHGMRNGDWVKLDDNAITFRCTYGEELSLIHI